MLYVSKRKNKWWVQLLPKTFMPKFQDQIVMFKKPKKKSWLLTERVKKMRIFFLCNGLESQGARSARIVQWGASIMFVGFQQMRSEKTSQLTWRLNGARGVWDLRERGKRRRAKVNVGPMPTRVTRYYYKPMSATHTITYTMQGITIYLFIF